MIHQKTIEAVYPLAEILNERNIRVTALEGTPLKTLTTNTLGPLPKGTSEDSLDAEARIREGSRRQGPDGVVEHDACMDEIVDVIGKSVRYNLDLARNTVNPIVREVVEDLQTHMERAEVSNQSHIEIQAITLPAIWDSPTLEQMVERYSETNIANIKRHLAFSIDVESQPIETYLHTGASAFDKEIDEWVEQMGSDYFLKVFESYFGAVDNPSKLSYTSKRSEWNGILAVHLFSRHFMENPQSSADIEITQWRQHMSEMMAQSGRLIVSLINQRRLESQSKVMVKFWPQEKGRERVFIEVNGDVYTSFLEQGGTPETLLGAYVSDRERGFSRLLENRAYYEREWERKLRVLNTSKRLNRFNIAVDGMREAVARQINEIDIDTLPVSKEILHRKLEENLSKLYGHWYESPYEYARVVVCDTMFPHTLARNILCAIDFVAKDNPDLEVREAALLATIEIVSNWISKLCNVEYLRT